MNIDSICTTSSLIAHLSTWQIGLLPLFGQNENRRTAGWVQNDNSILRQVQYDIRNQGKNFLKDFYKFSQKILLVRLLMFPSIRLKRGDSKGELCKTLPSVSGQE